MTNSNEIARIDVNQLVAERYPNRKIPGFIVKLLKKIACQDQINALFASAPGKKNLDFIDASMDYLRVSCQVVGKENLPDTQQPLIFVCNHPQGGIEAICIAYVLGHVYDSKIKFFANEVLTVLTPLREMFLPIFKHRMQNRNNARVITDFYQTDHHLVTFPAGVTSHKKKGKVTDREWSKNFITAAIRYQRDVVPLYFDARNSDMFYRIENFRKRIGSPVNFEVALFAHEFFRQQGKTFPLFVGKPIPWETFDTSRSPKEWAAIVRDIAFGLPGGTTLTGQK
ncbi:MAG: 1-acyl-sn-glycerol-3-phosphate acyltransferase [Tannerellaceae bacterium]|nr:1-acyl-sn-glycerol-3-phosphate acyltransferase [Tannerellaceae bacterium]